MEGVKPKPLLSLIFIPLSILIFLRPFISGLAYPAFEFWYEIIIILIAIITIAICRGGFKTLPYRYSIFPILLMLLAYIFSTITSINTQNSIKEILKFLSYISIFLIVSQSDDDQKKSLIKIIIISASIISLYTIYQYLWGYQHTIDYLKRTDANFLSESSYARDILLSKRAIGTFPSPNILGGYLIMAFFLSLTLIQSRSSSRGGLNLPYCCCAIIIILALILTKSLGAWLSLIAGLIVLVILSYNNLKKHKIILTLSSILIVSILAFIIINRWERIINLDNPQNSITQRLNYWRTAIAVIKGHPFMGVGPGNFQEVFLKYKVGLSTNTRYAHNIFLHVWAETGLLGLISIFLLIFTFLTKSITKSRYIFLAGLAFILHNLIDNTYLIPETGLLWWVLYGIITSGDKNV